MRLSILPECTKLDRLREQGAELRQELSETRLTPPTKSSREPRGGGPPCELAERNPATRGGVRRRHRRRSHAGAADLREDIDQRLDEAKGRLPRATRDAGRRPHPAALPPPTPPPKSERTQNRLDESFTPLDERGSRLSRTRKSLLRGKTRPPVRHSTTQSLQKLKKHLERFETTETGR